MIPPYLIGATPPPPGPQAAREAAVALAPTLLDRVFPPEACDFDYGDLWAAAGRSGLAYGAWSEPMTDVAS